MAHLTQRTANKTVNLKQLPRAMRSSMNPPLLNWVRTLTKSTVQYTPWKRGLPGSLPENWRPVRALEGKVYKLLTRQSSAHRGSRDFRGALRPCRRIGAFLMELGGCDDCEAGAHPGTGFCVLGGICAGGGFVAEHLASGITIYTVTVYSTAYLRSIGVRGTECSGYRAFEP